MTSDEPSIGGGGPRLISVEEAARILRVAESDVWQWIAAGKIHSVTVPGGQRLQLLSETHEGSGPNRGGFTSLRLHDADIDERTAREFQRELAGARRAAQRARLPTTEIDADALATALARSLAGVAPAQLSIVAEGGIVWIKNEEGHGAGSDIAPAVSDTGLSPHSKPVAQRSARSKWHRR